MTAVSGAHVAPVAPHAVAPAEVAPHSAPVTETPHVTTTVPITGSHVGTPSTVPQQNTNDSADSSSLVLIFTVGILVILGCVLGWSLYRLWKL
jgi:hypothetical protein